MGGYFINQPHMKTKPIEAYIVKDGQVSSEIINDMPVDFDSKFIGTSNVPNPFYAKKSLFSKFFKLWN